MQDPPFQTPPSVIEGGTIVVTVGEQVGTVYFYAPGHPVVSAPVVGGRAEYHLPPSVRGGSIVYVSDKRVPAPTTKQVEVIGGQNR
jgi:hypothetical protein